MIFGGPVILLALAGTFCSGSREPEPAKAGPAKPAPVKIAQFYASTGAVARGEQALLCYGVENARAVRIEPGVESLPPSYSRCVPVTPNQTTTYTLTAEGEDGTVATAKLNVEVVRGRPKPAAPGATPAATAPSGPVIAAFRTEKKPGLTLLCYEVEGAEAVTIDPAVLPRSGALRGCLGVAPHGPTTYTLTAYGHGGKIARRMLEVTP